MAAGGSNLDRVSREHGDLIEGIFEENISVENLMHSSLSDSKKIVKSVTIKDFHDDVDCDDFTENGSNFSDKFNSDDNKSVSSDKSNDEKPKVKSFTNSFKNLNLSMSSVTKKMRVPIDRLKNSMRDPGKSKPEESVSVFTDLSSVKIDKLPQLFTVKYLGMRKCSKLVGARVAKKHVDNMMKLIAKKVDDSGNIELPLKYVVISTKGLHFRDHPANVVIGEDDLVDCSLDSISYCVQDMQYWRVFTYILVKELSSRNHVAECHAFLCDSSVSARKMVVSLAAAFRIQLGKLRKEGLQNQQFCVELRTPTELKTSFSDDCDA